MPLYSFQSDAGLTQDIFYRMADVPSAGSYIVDDQGVKWRRVFTVPNAAIATQTDAYSEKGFAHSFDNKKVTIGDLFDASKEASDKRAAKEGVDPIKAKYLETYKKSRKGMEHNSVKKERFEAKQKELGISIKAAGL